MAFINGEATTAITISVSTSGTLWMSSGATDNIAPSVDADLLNPARLARARATSHGRIRVDFSSPVDNNDALVDVRNWRLWSFKDGEFQPPTVLGVEVPTSAGAQTSYVVLLTSEMNDGATYAVTVNSTSLSYGSNMFVAGDMENSSEALARWGLVGGPGLTDIATIILPGDTDRSLEVNMVVAGTPAGVYQAVTPHGRAYIVEGDALSDVGNPFMKVRWRPDVGPVVDLWGVQTSGSVGSLDWTRIDGGGGNRYLIYTPTRPGYFEFMVEDASAATGYWDNLSARALLGAGAPGVPPITSFGNELARDVVSFSGVGVAPKIKMALATSPYDVVIYFTEKLQTDAGTISIDAGSFSGGLSVSAVTEIGPDFIRVRTVEQTPDAVYNMAINSAVIKDLAGNVFDTPALVSVLGYTEQSALVRKQPLDMYRFLIEVIRREDQKNGAQFLQRFLKGPQDVWEVMTSTALSLPKLWSVEEAPNGVLQYLKSIVGWTQKLDLITGGMDDDLLRRLISVSAPFWKDRGSDDLMEDFLRMLTGARVRVLDWFWYRSIVDEMELSEDMSGYDPWAPEDPDVGHDHVTYVVRIVDDGTLDRALVRNVLKLMRPTGERVEVAYVAFYDAFSVTGDTSQWSVPFGATVDNGVLAMMDAAGEEAVLTVSGASDWTSYTATVRTSGSGLYYIDVYRLEFGGHPESYRLEVDVENNSVYLVKISGGLSSFMVVVEFSPELGHPPLAVDEFDTFRFVLTPLVAGSTTNDIKVYRNGDLIIQATDDVLNRGTIAVGHSAGAHVRVSEVEVFLNPMNSDFIDINS